MSHLNEKQKSLLNNLTNDEKKYGGKLYSAGPYWNYKNKKILFWLKKGGIHNFRGLNSGVGTSYTDNIISDFRNELGIKGRIVSLITHLPIIKNIYEGQLNLTLDKIQEYIKRNAEYYESNEKVKYLISKYKIDNAVEFGCELIFKINNKSFSCHYLDICERVDTISKFVDFSKIKTFFEIGGGFGSNVHFLINNFKNIKKIVYLDMVPNLFVGTEYLKYFFGDAVKDYNFLRKKEKILFTDNEELEILCIPPWQIENLSITVDHFYNSASFQEMPVSVVKNYSKYIMQFLSKKKSISLITYGNWELNNTLDPTTINNLFNNCLSVNKFSTLVDKEKKLFYLLSKNL